MGSFIQRKWTRKHSTSLYEIFCGVRTVITLYNIYYYFQTIHYDLDFKQIWLGSTKETSTPNLQKIRASV